MKKNDIICTDRLEIVDNHGICRILLEGGDQDTGANIKLNWEHEIIISSKKDESKIGLYSNDAIIEISIINNKPTIVLKNRSKELILSPEKIS